MRDYISDGWNQLDCLAIGFFIIGFTIKLQAYRKISAQVEDAYNHLIRNRTQTVPFPSTTEAFPLAADHSWWLTAGFLQQSTELFGNNETTDFLSGMETVWNSSESILSRLTDFLTGNIVNETIGLTWNVDDPYFLLTNQLVLLSRIFYALSLFAFYVRLMYIFSFSMVLGPKLIMINRMVSTNYVGKIFICPFIKNNLGQIEDEFGTIAKQLAAIIEREISFSNRLCNMATDMFSREYYFRLSWLILVRTGWQYGPWSGQNVQLFIGIALLDRPTR